MACFVALRICTAVYFGQRRGEAGTECAEVTLWLGQLTCNSLIMPIFNGVRKYLLVWMVFIAGECMSDLRWIDPTTALTEIRGAVIKEPPWRLGQEPHPDYTINATATVFGGRKRKSRHLVGQYC